MHCAGAKFRVPGTYAPPPSLEEGEQSLAKSVRRRLRDGHAEGYFQVVAVEWVDVDHPAECLFEQVTAGCFALRGVGDFSGEAEAPVGQEAEALVDCGRGGTRRHR